MTPFRSISWRLQFWYGLLLAAVLVALGVAAWRLERTRLERALDDELRLRVSGLVRVLRGPPRRRDFGEFGLPGPEARPGPGMRIPPDFAEGPDAATYGRQADGRIYYYDIWLLNGPQETRSPDAPEGIPEPSGGQEGLRSRGSWREAFLMTAPNDYLLVGASTGPDEAALRRFAAILAGTGACVLAVGLLGGSWLVRRALRPIGDISATAARIAQGDLSQRIALDETAGELGVLAGVLNDSFSRLEAAFARQVRFTGDAAHELRTPVTVILTHAQNGLAARGGTEEQREAFAACQRAAQRMRGLIESLLQLARLDAGQGALARVRVDLADVARGGAEFIYPLAVEGGIALHVELGPAGCLGDPRCLDQVVTNLLANALHYNRRGGEVRVRTRTEGGWAILSVADTGVGIAAEHLPHIFERFYRADAARTSAAGRTGLGLAIARAVVDAHGGSIHVESAVGQGTTFEVRLPAA
jgi:two-component system OmpR family sensor kinase